MAHEADSPLTEDVDFVRGNAIVLGMLTHRKAKSLTDDIVEGHSEEVATQSQQAHAVDSVELAPLGLLLEQFVDLNGLSPLTHLNWKVFLFFLKF